MVDSTNWITSVNVLGAHGALRPMFSPVASADVMYYDDGPPAASRRTHELTSLSGSMGHLSSSYPYAQGVEITKDAQYNAGPVKIWSGERQHRLSPSVFGQDRNFFFDPCFAEMELFDPVRYLVAQETDSPLHASIFTFPIVTGDNDQLENYNFNGVIEPLSIRSVVAFFSTDAPFESHTVRGAVMAGNLDQSGGSDQPLTVDVVNPGRQAIGYLDMVDMIDGHPLNGFFRHEFSHVTPFFDKRLVREGLDSYDQLPSDFVAALSLMTGSTDNYVRHDERSAACGWYYDGTNVGTDSLAFGGMTY